LCSFVVALLLCLWLADFDVSVAAAVALVDRR